jgi:predicted nucleotidyltransferase component of viral defense system
MPKIELIKLQKDTLFFIGKGFFGKNFYWTGGTLLSYLYFSHRFSVDLDFFSDELFRDEEYLEAINKLKKNIKANKITQTIQHNRKFYFIEKGKENVKLEFVFFPFPAVEKKTKVKEFSVKADSLSDIMVNKILSTYQRNEVKDIYDLYWYLSNKPKYNIIKLIKLVERKFGVAIEPVLLLEKINELCNNLDSLSPLLIKNEPNSTVKIRAFFQETFNNIVKNKS